MQRTGEYANAHLMLIPKAVDHAAVEINDTKGLRSQIATLKGVTFSVVVAMLHCKGLTCVIR